MKLQSSFLLVVLAFAAALSARAYEPVPGQAYVYHVGQAMHADIEFHIYGRTPDTDLEYLRTAALDALAAVDALDPLVNYWKPDSEISRVNRDAADGPVKVSPTVFSLLNYAKVIWRDTKGASDISVGPLVALWGINKQQGHLPAQSELDQALPKVGMDKVILDAKTQTVQFTVPGVQLDLGGIAKGLAVDRAANVLRDKGITSALISAGTSSIVAIGAPPGAAGWNVKIRGPYNREDTIDEVLLRDESISTSAGYERFVEIGGKKYCHIFDPKTGQPAEGVYSVSVIGPTGLLTDALDTGFFVLGVSGAREYCETHRDVKVVLISDNNGRPEPVKINFDERKKQQ